MTNGAFLSGVSPGSWFSSRVLDQYFTTRNTPAKSISRSTLNSLLSSAQSSKSQLTSLNRLYSLASNVANAVDEISTENTDSVFYKQSATSSHSDIVKTISINIKDYENTESDTSFEFDISQLAKEQVNTGTALDTDDSGAIETGDVAYACFFRERFFCSLADSADSLMRSMELTQ